MFSTTKLEDYFDFFSDDEICLKGHRIGIDNVLDYYLEGYTSEEISANLPSLSLEKIHATITYYLHNRAQIDAYLRRLAQKREKHYQEWSANPSPLVQRLRAEKAKRFEIKLKEQ
ncbi:MAG: DUF433 domain-containing protein [Xenococcaceae cyanobacterium MO_207.B15]|nr:DUF433 domain-containing protein [Xenococcaceae cyanobacterium MO_207.B15]MDJ0742432.1 DUF433 domain-containing protein [Xenococcaceae cyanobacterium MO_167.B27]